MNQLIFKFLIIANLLAVAVVPIEPVCSQERSLVLGLDHIIMAVSDLERAAESYRMLGFTLKPGRPHENGIQNRHVKFTEGTEIELITAPEARDPLTAEYLRFLASGDGPAFVGFYAPEQNKLAENLDTIGKTYRREGRLLTFPESDELRYIFFGQRTGSTTDRPEHFRHPNGAYELIGVWIAGGGLESEHRLFTELGAEFAETRIQVPLNKKVEVAKFQQSEVVLLPDSCRLLPGRRIVGVSVRVRDIETVRRVLTKNFSNQLESFRTAGSSLFIPPSIAHGIWLEFRQEK